MKIKVKINLSEKRRIKKWIVKQPESPWIINPENDQADTKSDIVFDGLDLTTDQNNFIKDIGFSLSLDHLENVIIKPKVPIKIGLVALLVEGYVQATDYGDQNIIYDKKSNIIKWQFDLEAEDQLVRIAENVIIGVRQDFLQSIMVYL